MRVVLIALLVGGCYGPAHLGDLSVPVEAGSPGSGADPDQSDAAASGLSDAAAVDEAGGEFDGGETPGNPPSQLPDASTDAGVTDGSADSGADAGPCVKWVEARGSAQGVTWAFWADYSTSDVPFYGCVASTNDGISCRNHLISKGAQMTADETYRLYPSPGACRIDVPAQCLPCTAGQTQW